MDATMARVADIVGTLRSMGGATARTTGAMKSSSSTASTASTSSSGSASTASTVSSGSSATSAADFATALVDATAGPAETDAATATSGGGADGDAVVSDARKYLGVAYKWGGTNPATGLDCSGLTQRVFADLGVKIPRTVAQQQHSGTAVSSMAKARPGDLLVFGTHHIGIYVGDGKMLHAPHSGEVVKVAKVYETPTKIRRIVGDGVSGTGAASGTSTAYARPVALRGSGSTAYDDLFTAATNRYHLPAGLLKSVARAESSFNPRAHSPAGAVGLMQLMPATARELGVDPSDPAEAVDGAARLLRSHLDRFGSVRLAVAAYNAGAGAVRRYDGVPPYSETRTYVQRVLSGMGAAA
jgi:cell wall-associated NlpC family hydrolase